MIVWATKYKSILTVTGGVWYGIKYTKDYISKRTTLSFPTTPSVSDRIGDVNE